MGWTRKRRLAPTKIVAPNRISTPFPAAPAGPASPSVSGGAGAYWGRRRATARALERRTGDGFPGPGGRSTPLAIWLATEIVPGIEARSAPTVIVAALVLGLVNAIVRPVLLVLTLPLTLVTLGLFLFVLNALCLWLTSAIVPGFEVRGFWPAFGARCS